MTKARGRARFEMKKYAVFAILITLLAINPAAWAQDCYTPVKSWQGNYTLTAKAKNVTCVFGQATCNVNQSVSVTLNPYFLNKSSCTEMYWVPPEALDRLTRASVNDTITTPCIGGGQSTITFEGASGGSATDILSLGHVKK